MIFGSKILHAHNIPLSFFEMELNTISFCHLWHFWMIFFSTKKMQKLFSMKFRITFDLSFWGFPSQEHNLANSGKLKRLTKYHTQWTIQNSISQTSEWQHLSSLYNIYIKNMFCLCSHLVLIHISFDIFCSFSFKIFGYFCHYAK